MKKVLFDISCLGSGYSNKEARTGVYKVAEIALNKFINNNNFDVYFYVSRGNNDECYNYIKKYYPKMLNKLIKKQKFKLINMIKYIFSKRYDVYFTPYNEIPRIFQINLHIRKYIIIYDLIQVLHPEWCPENCFKRYSKLLKSLDDKTVALCISEYTKHDLLKANTKIKEENVYVIPLGAEKYYNSNYSKEEIDNVKRKYNIDKYFFSISSMNPRKNFAHIVKCFIKYIEKYNLKDVQLALAGPSGWGEILKDINLTKNKNQIKILGYVPEKDLPKLYQGCIASLYLSLYEGFGLPLLESIKCGAPVIASNVTSIPEVLGNAGILIDPFDENKLIDAYKDIYDNNFNRELFLEEAQKQITKYTWENFEQKIMETIK